MRLLYLFLSFLVSLCLATSSLAVAKDVRILVDVSGSMQDNDPNNLRAQALTMLVDLLPQGIEAGIWQFGTQSNELVSHGTVNLRWRARAKDAISKVRSNQSYTNIAQVLEQASSKPSRYGDAVYILITDGKVDISKDRLANLNSRNQIISDIAPKIKQKGGTLYTIALSKDADQQLLDYTAFLTGGRFALAESAQQLQSLLVSIFDQSIASDELPITANQFFVDTSVQEFTALIFHGGDQIELLSPSQEFFSSSTSSLGVNWANGAGFTMVTVKEPSAGEWHIAGQINPGSRVTVVSDVRLQLEALPENIWLQDALDIGFYLSESKGIVKDARLLEQIEVDAKLNNASRAANLSINQQVPKWQLTSGALNDTGLWRLTVAVDGKSFKRQRTFAVNVRSPLSFISLPRNENYEIRFDVLNAQLKNQVDSPVVLIEGPGLALEKVTLLKHAQGYWFARVSPFAGNGAYKATLLLDNDISQTIELAPLWLEFPLLDANQSAKTMMVEAMPEPEITPEPIVAPIEIKSPVITAAPTQMVMAPWRKQAIIRVAETMPELALKAPKTVMVAVTQAPMMVESTPTAEPEMSEEMPAEDVPFWVYLLSSLVGLALLIGMYLMYRRFEQRILQEQKELQEDGFDEPEDDEIDLAQDTAEPESVEAEVEQPIVTGGEEIFDEEPELEEDISQGIDAEIDSEPPEELLDIDDFDLADEVDESEEESEQIEDMEAEPEVVEGTDEDDELDAILDDLDDDFGDLDEELGDSMDDDLDDLLDAEDDLFGDADDLDDIDEDENDDDFDPLASLDDFDDLDDPR